MGWGKSQISEKGSSHEAKGRIVWGRALKEIAVSRNARRGQLTVKSGLGKEISKSHPRSSKKKAKVRETAKCRVQYL